MLLDLDNSQRMKELIMLKIVGIVKSLLLLDGLNVLEQLIDQLMIYNITALLQERIFLLPESSRKLNLNNKLQLL